jgi:hypothetical protein
MALDDVRGIGSLSFLSFALIFTTLVLLFNLSCSFVFHLVIRFVSFSPPLSLLCALLAQISFAANEGGEVLDMGL